VFEQRSKEEELLDSQECDPEIATESYRFMEKVNRMFGGIRHVRDFIEAEARVHTSGRPLRILDIGSGSCDIPIAICQWAREKNIPIEFTCLEITEPAILSAQKNIARSGETAVTVLHEDVFTHEPAEAYDCAVASMCFHHFDDTQILTLLRSLREFVRHSVLINDLHRTRLAWLGTTLFTVFSHAGVKHDSRLSIRRGFRVKELRDLIMQLDDVTVVVKPVWLFRIRAIVNLKQEGQE